MQDAHSQPATDATPPSGEAPVPNSPAAVAIVLPDDLTACHALIQQLSRTVVEIQAARQSDVASRDLTISSLEAYVRKLLNQLHGHRSEKRTFDPKQQVFDFADDPAAEDALREAAAEAEKILEEYTLRRVARKKRTPRRDEKFPAHLPRVEETIDPPAENKECPEHGAKQLIGYDTTETLELEPPKLWVRVRKFPKYACPQAPTCGVTQAARPEGLVEGDRFGTSVATAVITNKYAYHQPLYREQDLFACGGWTPSRSTLLNILVAGTEVARPLAEYLFQQVLTSGGVGCDDTWVNLIVPPLAPGIDPDSPRSKRVHEVLSAAIERNQPSVKARMWAYRSFTLPINAFDFTVSRHRDGPQDILRDFRGTLMADCYSGFDSVVLASDSRIARAACWSHARRKFDELEDKSPHVSAVMLAMIGQLYDVEDRAKDLTAEDRRALRETRAPPILARIAEYLDQPAIRDALPKSELCQAANYVRNNWNALCHYAGDGACPIDNNDVEQLMRQVALGRKNWLFIGSVPGGERAATLMTLVSSAIRNHLDVSLYLKDVLDQLLRGCRDYESLCPHVWAQTHPHAVRTYRIDERRDAAQRKRVKRARRRLSAK